MSASVGVYVATALFLVYGGETEEAMRPDVWKQAGLCVPHCEWDGTPSPACKRRREQWLPCMPDWQSEMLWGERANPELSWNERPGPDHRIYDLLLSPKWVISDQPTVYTNEDGKWMKLQL